MTASFDDIERRQLRKEQLVQLLSAGINSHSIVAAADLMDAVATAAAESEPRQARASLRGRLFSRLAAWRLTWTRPFARIGTPVAGGADADKRGRAAFSVRFLPSRP